MLRRWMLFYARAGGCARKSAPLCSRWAAGERGLRGRGVTGDFPPNLRAAAWRRHAAPTTTPAEPRRLSLRAGRPEFSQYLVRSATAYQQRSGGCARRAKERRVLCRQPIGSRVVGFAIRRQPRASLSMHLGEMKR